MITGRDLDALVAEKVMGFPSFAEQVVSKLSTHIRFNHEACVICGRQDDTRECLPKYSTEIAAAWEVVEKLREKDFLVSIRTLKSGKIRCLVFSPDSENGPGVRAISDTAPHAVCLAALKACGVEV